MNDHKIKIAEPFMQGQIQLAEKELEKAEKIAEVYAAFGIKIKALIGIRRSEKSTRFDFEVDSEIALAKVKKLRDDVSLFLSVPPVELTIPLSGKASFGIEIPNQ